MKFHQWLFRLLFPADEKLRQELRFAAHRSAAYAEDLQRLILGNQEQVTQMVKEKVVDSETQKVYLQVTLKDYYAAYPEHPEITNEMMERAHALLHRVNVLLRHAQNNGVLLLNNPRTGTLISGEKNGGWRPSDCPIGASSSAHKQSRAVDIFDPTSELDSFITDELLEELDLYREHPNATPGWCHLTDRAPRSGNRSFYP